MSRYRGTGAASGCAGASSQGTGQKASSEEVEGANRDRLSRRFCAEEHASMQMMSGIMAQSHLT